LTFPHFGVTDEELHQVEDFVNARIQEQLPLIERRDIPLHRRKKVLWLCLVKYGDHVRAIKFERAWSFVEEFTKNTGEIWYFKIVSEGAVAAGIRRIEAITGDSVKGFFARSQKMH
jgi:alanyl-tRNA synthetase